MPMPMWFVAERVDGWTIALCLSPQSLHSTFWYHESCHLKGIFLVGFRLVPQWAAAKVCGMFSNRKESFQGLIVGYHGQRQ